MCHFIDLEDRYLAELALTRCRRAAHVSLKAAKIIIVLVHMLGLLLEQFCFLGLSKAASKQHVLPPPPRPLMRIRSQHRQAASLMFSRGPKMMPAIERQKKNLEPEARSSNPSDGCLEVRRKSGALTFCLRPGKHATYAGLMAELQQVWCYRMGLAFTLANPAGTCSAS